MDFQTDGLQNINFRNPFVSSDCWEEKSEERTYAYMNDIDKNLISDLIKP